MVDHGDKKIFSDRYNQQSKILNAINKMQQTIFRTANAPHIFNEFQCLILRSFLFYWVLELWVKRPLYINCIIIIIIIIKFYMTTRLCFLYCVVCINLGPASRALIAFFELLIF